MTQDIKHTPAPWMVRHSPRNSDDFFVQANKIDPSHPYDIEILGDDYGTELYPTKMRLADAHLISAAPDMAAAIECSIALDYAHQDALKVLEKHGYDHSNRFELNATDFVHGLKVAALKKAKGQS